MKSGINGFYPIPGYENRYEINYHGVVQRIWPVSGKRTITTPCIKRGEYRTRLTDTNGVRKEFKTAHLMAIVFMRNYKKGDIVYHIDGCKTNNELSNLKIITNKELGKLTGASSRRKPVVKLTSNGEPLEFYSSAREAAKKNHMSYQAVMDACNHKIKRGTACDGFVYMWQDSYYRKEKV